MARSRRQRQRQRGGDYNFTGAQIAGYGAPAGAVVTQANPHCQSGGGCGCMIAAPQTGGNNCIKQYGGGHGYSVDVGSHEFGKMGAIVAGSCQKGGQAPYGDFASMAGGPSAVSPLDMNTHGAGYSNGPAALSPSANFMVITPYNSKGGRHRNTVRIKKNRKASRRSRR